MSGILYQVLIDGNKVAGNVTLEIALILTKALFQEYFNDHGMQICIMEEEAMNHHDQI